MTGVAGIIPRAVRNGAALLQGALLDSRQRWRDFVTLTADIAFETDATGRITFLSPDEVLGRSADTLLGQPGSALLSTETDGPDPFTAGPQFHGRRVWLRRADGGSACFALSAAPMMSGADCTGMRGIGRDITAQEQEDAKITAALRRGEVVQHILWQMRQEVLAPRMMQAVLEGLCAALGASGALVLNSTNPARTERICWPACSTCCSPRRPTRPSPSWPGIPS